MIPRPRNLLFATDLGERCDRPFQRALMLARYWQARLVLLHVLEHGRGLANAEREAEEARVRHQLLASLEETGVPAEIRIAVGSVASAVAEAAEESDAELIVAGVARRNELGDFILGSTVDRLVRRSPVPVLVVRERAQEPYRTVLVATDFSETSAWGLETAALFFPDADLNLAHAYHVALDAVRSRDANAPELQARIAEELASFLHGLPDELEERIDFHVDYGETREVIGAIAQSLGADLAVIGSHGRSGFVAAAIGSKAEALLASLPCDVMLVPHRR